MAQEEEVEAIELEDSDQIFIVSELNDSISSHQIDDDEDYEIVNYIDEQYQLDILNKQRKHEAIQQQAM